MVATSKPRKPKTPYYYFSFFLNISDKIKYKIKMPGLYKCK